MFRRRRADDRETVRYVQYLIYLRAFKSHRNSSARLIACYLHVLDIHTQRERRRGSVYLVEHSEENCVEKFCGPHSSKNAGSLFDAKRQAPPIHEVCSKWISEKSYIRSGCCSVYLLL